MINEAHVSFAGYVAAEPSYKVFPNGSTQARLRLAYTARRLNRETGEWGDGPTSFVNVYCWRQLATHVAMCVRKGEPLVVHGRLQVRRYQHRDGTPGTAVEIEASALGHDLSRGVAQFSRIRKQAGATAAENAGILIPAGMQAATGPAGQPLTHQGTPPSPAGQEMAGEEAAGNVVDEDAVAEFARELSELREAPDVTHSPPPDDDSSPDDPPTETPVP